MLPPRFRLAEKYRNLISDSGRAGARTASDLEYSSHEPRRRSTQPRNGLDLNQ